MKNIIPKSLNNQQGVALLTVLLLVVSITVVAGVMLVSQSITTRKSTLLIEQDRLAHHIESGQKLAIETIRTEAKTNKTDSLHDIWSKDLPPIQTDDGYTIKLKISDASGKFNINNLYHNGAIDDQAYKSFVNLLIALQIDESLAKTILDWQDPDSMVYEDNGDEASLYQRGSIKVANQPFVDIDQIADLPDVTPEIITKLKHYTTAVPYFLPVNANTADPKLIEAIAGPENKEGIQQLLSSRQSQPVTREFLEELGLITSKSDEGDNGDDGSDGGEASKKESLLDDKSGAFDVLITVNDSGSKQPKSRYATLKISKQQKENEFDEANSDTGEEVEVKISSFSRRIWAFRPLFITSGQNHS